MTLRTDPGFHRRHRTILCPHQGRHRRIANQRTHMRRACTRMGPKAVTASPLSGFACVQPVHPRALGYSHFPDFRSYCLVIGPTIGGDSQSNPPEVRRNRPNGMRQTAAKSSRRLAPGAAPHQTTGDRVKRARGKPRSPQPQYSQRLSQGHARLSPGRTPSFLPSRRRALQDLEL